MVIVYHNGIKVVELSDTDFFTLEKAHRLSIAGFMVALAVEFPEELLIWCHINLKELLNVSEIEKLFHHKKLLLSYNPSVTDFLDKSIGYVDESPFVRINKLVPFATWQMSSFVGGIHASLVLALKDNIAKDKNFDYFLSSLAKLGMRKGLLCYSEPRLLKQNQLPFSAKTSSYTLFRFVKQHYKTQWIFLLLLDMLLYERKFPILPFLFSLFYKNRSNNTINFDIIPVQSSRKGIDKATVDVIIPTIGRKEYLYDVLKDFSKQTLLPNKIIIVEQNPDKSSKSELDYIYEEQWPFEIQHFFIHQAGACNARNLALDQTESEWVFLADDDIRIGSHFVQKAVEEINKYGVKVVSMRCFQKGEDQKESVVFQWITFGAGCSFVFAKSLKNCEFRMGYEFGYGEDGDFGMQLRNSGNDILYLPEPEILHLKAAVGGFRTKPKLQWQEDPIQPKPSPTIMLFKILHNSQEQVLGYKTILFFKYYKLQQIKNPFRYFVNFRKQWGRSIFWAKELKRQNEI